MESSDKDAVRAALKDPEAFSVLIERYKEPLSRYIRRMATLDAEVAKDILQESFIKVYLNLNGYNQSLSFSSWIYRITHNEVMLHLRSMKNRPQAYVSGDALALFEHIPDGLDLEKEVDGEQQGIKVRDALERIIPLHREMLVLRYFEGKSYAEISDILEMAPGTVATNISRGKAALKKALSEVNITGV